MRKALPVRATRGQRLSAAEVEAGSGDEEFWGQDFFQDEGEQDDEYKTESEPEDQVDSDFELSVRAVCIMRGAWTPTVRSVRGLLEHKPVASRRRVPAAATTTTGLSTGSPGKTSVIALYVCGMQVP